MPIPIHNSRSRDLEAYLDEIEKLSLAKLDRDYPGVPHSTLARFAALFRRWKEQMKELLAGLLEDNKAWRRIEYVLEECLLHIGKDEDVLNRGATDVASKMEPQRFLSIVQTACDARVPAWVNDHDHPLPVVITFRRLEELKKRLESMRDKIIESQRQGYDHAKLKVWIEGIEVGMTRYVHIDEEWFKINHILDEIMREFEQGGTLLDGSEQIKHNLTFQGILKTLSEPWTFKQDFPRQRTLHSMHDSRRINSRAAFLYGIRTSGAAEGGGRSF